MDKKNTTIGILLLIAAMGLLFWQNRQMAAQQEELARAREEQRAEMIRQANQQQQQSPVQQGYVPAPAAEIVSAPSLPPPVVPNAPEQRPVLENEFIRVEFTSHGGAIGHVAFKKYAAVQGEDAPYIFNEAAKAPLLAIDKWQMGILSAQTQAYAVDRIDTNKVVFRSEIAPGVSVVRSYEISSSSEGPDPYTISHKTSIINKGAASFEGGDVFLDLGASAPDASDYYGYNINTGYYDGDSYTYKHPSDFSGGGWFSSSEPKAFIQKDARILWASTKNSFFASILTPTSPARTIVMKPVDLGMTSDGKTVKGMSGAIGFGIGSIEPGQSADISLSCYIGPKEYRRLSQMELRQDRVMQFGWSSPLGFIGRFVGFVGKLFYTGLTAVQQLVVNWGLAIILMTIAIRLLFWPLTAKAAENSRKMARLQGPLKELREKYKDNQTKLSQETMALFKKYKVNPLAGCLPILIQIPIFIAFYYMLRGASELRFAHFLWISDLSLPDTIATISGFPVNILPLLMGFTMFYQMHLAPTPGMDPMQAKIMKFMPLVMLFFCYNFSSGLVLYWTVSNCMSILQQLYTNHKRTQEELAIAAEAPGKVTTTQAPRMADLSHLKKKKK